MCNNAAGNYYSKHDSYIIARSPPARSKCAGTLLLRVVRECEHM